MASVQNTYSLPVGLRCLSTTEVAQGPGSITEHAQLAAIAKKGKKRTKSTGLEDKVAAGRAITSNVTKGPDSLFPDIRLMAAQQLDENGDRARFNDDLCLLGGTGGNVGQSPSGLKLYQSVGGAKELDKSADDACFNDPFDGGVALLGKQLPELCGCLDLLVDLVGEDALYHLREFFIEL